MQGVLRFKLPEEEAEFRTTLDAGAWKNIAWEMESWLRQETKHAPEHTPRIEALQEVRNKLHEFLNDDNLNLFG